MKDDGFLLAGFFSLSPSLARFDEESCYDEMPTGQGTEGR